MLVSDMLEVIRHRGPDDRGEWYHKDVAFGHVRLSIIDIAQGRQPMTTLDGRYTIIFNGEIYNYLELRQGLANKGHQFRTHSDTEVLLAMYAEYGKECVHHLNGMFAFAVYDVDEDILFLARDHLGIKQLYYYQDRGSFVFASEIKALLKFPGIRPEVDKRSLYEYLTFQMVLKKHTLFKGICALEPATYLIVRNGKIAEKHEYWKLNYEIDTERTEDEFADELLILLENAMSIQLRSDVPVGSHLSGGLDSSIVAILAAKNYFGDFQTFCGGFRHSEAYDETRYATVVSQHIGSMHHTVFPTPDDFLTYFPKLVYSMDYPCGGPGMFPQFIVSKCASEQVKVVLGGQGGDEVFGGYARYLVAYLEQCLKSAIFEEDKDGVYVATLKSIISSLPMLKQYVPMLKAQFSSGLFDPMDRRYFSLVDRSPGLPHIYSGDVVQRQDKESLFDKFCQIFHKPDTASYINKMTYFDIKTLLPTLLHIEDRMSMAVSLESRVPLLDKRIVELSVRIPPVMKFAEGKSKYILAKSVQNILPREILARKDKMGFPTPFNEWLAGPLRDFALDILTGKKAKERGLFNVSSIEQHIDKAQVFSRDLWGALNIEMWYRTFIDA